MGGAKYTTLFNHERAESNSTVLYIPDIIMLFERRNVRTYAAMQSLSKYFVFNFFNTSKEEIYIYILKKPFFKIAQGNNLSNISSATAVWMNAEYSFPGAGCPSYSSGLSSSKSLSFQEFFCKSYNESYSESYRESYNESCLRPQPHQIQTLTISDCKESTSAKTAYMHG